MDVAVETDGGVEDTVEPHEGDGAVGLVVDVEAEGVLVEIEQHAHHTARLYPAVRAVRVLVVVHEPAALRVDVHTPGFVILACNTGDVSAQVVQLYIVILVCDTGNVLCKVVNLYIN